MSSSFASEREALQRENVNVQDKVDSLTKEKNWQLGMRTSIFRAEDKALVTDDAMKAKFGWLQHYVAEVSIEMAELLHNPSHRDRVFYSSTGQNAAYYIKNIDEIDYMMQHENESTPDQYARRMWRKQAIDAMFPTGRSYGNEDPIDAQFPAEDHPWLASTRQERIEKLALQLLRALDVFLESHPRGLELTRQVVANAVQLNEWIMHQAGATYTVDLDITSESDDDFYNSLNKMTMAVVKTDSGKPVNIDEEMRRQTLEYIRSRLYKVCTIMPALKSQNINTSDPWDITIAETLTNVKSRVAVGWALNRENLNPPENPRMFYIMAQSLGFAPLG